MNYSYHVIEVRQTEAFAKWLKSLRDAKAAAKIAQRIVRVSSGLLGDMKPVGQGVSELRIDFGPGYRIYFMQRSEILIILLCGGDKSTQARDIRKAKELAADLQAAPAMETSMATRTLPFDPAEHLADPEDQAELLNDALDTGNAVYIANALGIIARARGMSEVARGAGVTREALYKAFSDKGDPRLSTLLGVLKTLDLKLSARPAKGGGARRSKAARKAA